MSNKYNNTVILSQGGEHGKRVIEWWKEQGVDTRHYEGNKFNWFYGIINENFDTYSLEQVQKANAKIIELPEDKPQIIDLSNVEGVEMMVSHDKKKWFKGTVIASLNDGFIDSTGNVWNFAKPIEVKKVTMEDIEEMFGFRVEIVKEVSNEQ